MIKIGVGIFPLLFVLHLAQTDDRPHDRSIRLGRPASNPSIPILQSDPYDFKGVTEITSRPAVAQVPPLPRLARRFTSRWGPKCRADEELGLRVRQDTVKYRRPPTSGAGAAGEP